MSVRERVLLWFDDHKLVTDKTARQRAHNAFELGVDAGMSRAAELVRAEVNRPSGDRRG